MGQPFLPGVMHVPQEKHEEPLTPENDRQLRKQRNRLLAEQWAIFVLKDYDPTPWPENYPPMDHNVD